MTGWSCQGKCSLGRPQRARDLARPTLEPHLKTSVGRLGYRSVASAAFSHSQGQTEQYSNEQIFFALPLTTDTPSNR